MIKIQTVRKDSIGVSVVILQALLRGMQYTGADGKPIEIDGRAGDNTVFAIREFQRKQIAYGAPECGSDGKPDGHFGPACWARLLGIDINAEH